MADGLPGETLLVMAMLIALAGVGAVELWYLRRRRKQRTSRGESETELPERAHNAIVTVKAIGDTLARGGVRSPEADDLIREAEAAARERKYRVAIELTDRAKAVLRAAKLRQQQKGDLSKFDGIKPKAEADEVTAKERLMKDLPPNYAQSKFSMDLARDGIASAKTAGRDTGEAESLVASAQASFDAQDYAAALKQAVRARRSLEGVSVPSTEPAPEGPPPTPAPPTGTTRPCPSCGSPVAADDAFCRKCGVAVPRARACPSCGAPVAPEDGFCRKCGTRIPEATGNP